MSLKFVAACYFQQGRCAMKKLMVLCLAVALAIMTFGCSGGSLTAPDSVQPVGNHKVTVANGVMNIDLAFRDGKVHKLVRDDGNVEEADAALFTHFVWTGDADLWRSTHKVSYAGGSSVTIAVPAHDAGNGYFLTASGERYWLDLGQTDGSGCSVVLQKEHDRHVIVW